MDENYQAILQLILGADEYTEIFARAFNEYKDGNYKVGDLDVIIEHYLMSILVIGFSKKKVEIDKYDIHLNRKPNINIDANKFCEDYKKYIDKVEQYKFNLLRRIIYGDNYRSDLSEK